MPEVLFFPYFGPNRHSDLRVVECRLDFSRDKGNEFPRQVSDIQQILIKNGILDSTEKFPQQPSGKNRINWYASLFVQTALLLQRKNGHRVEYFSVSSDPQKNRCVALVEHEDSETALAAITLTTELFSGKSELLIEPLRQFSVFARSRALSPETVAIINSACRRNIPFYQFDRAPFSDKIDTGFRVRRNGLLCLGLGINNQVLDGTFCLSRASDYVKALLRNPAQRMTLLKQLGIAVIHDGAGNANDRGLLQLLVINGKVTTISRAQDGAGQLISNVHESFTRQVLAISEKVEIAPIVVTYQGVDSALSSAQSDGIAVKFELAPDLNKLFLTCPSRFDLLDEAADDLVNWLYPDQGGARIPVVAVTGTNGKTTTSRMIRHIFNHNGFKTGLVCTDGVFLGQKQISSEDSAAFVGHARVLTSKMVDAAILESHHRGIAVRGFAFQKCDVAICLNVTEEHLAEGEIETLEEMTGIKRALVERAAHAAILFADDANCLSMIEHLKSDQICLVSLRSSAEQLSESGGKKPASYCVLEMVENRQWIVLYCDQKRYPVMPVNEIPATFNGTALVNVSNAMHATAASYFSGIDISSIKSALSGFSAGLHLTPGRMNVFDGLPFRLIMDFAHNPDAIQKICEFADLQQVSGRKIIAFAGLTKRPYELNRKTAKTVAGHFDFYFCKDYEPSSPPKRRFMGPFMQSVLVEEGVSKEATTVLTFGMEVIFKILDSCNPGDMLFLLVGSAESRNVPAYIQAYTERYKGRN